MKSILRNTGINALALYILVLVVDGVKISGGIPTFLLGAVLFYLMSLILRPILNIITFPINVLTFGIFSFFVNAILLYLLTTFVAQISVSAFKFQGLSFLGFVIPKIYFNTFFAFVVSSFVLSFTISFMQWLVKK